MERDYLNEGNSNTNFYHILSAVNVQEKGNSMNYIEKSMERDAILIQAIQTGKKLVDKEKNYVGPKITYPYYYTNPIIHNDFLRTRKYGMIIRNTLCRIGAALGDFMQFIYIWSPKNMLFKLNKHQHQRNYSTGLVGLAALFISQLLGYVRIFEGVIDPTLGMFINKTETKFGKYRPLMLLGNLITILSFAVLFTTHLLPESARLIVLIIALFVHKIRYSLQASVIKAGQYILTNDPKQRPCLILQMKFPQYLPLQVVKFLSQTIYHLNMVVTLILLSSKN